MNAPPPPPLNFKENCLSRVHIEENRPAETCERLGAHLFVGEGLLQEQVQELKPAQVGARAFPSDDVTRFLVFQNPMFMPAYVYCYFQFRGWFNPKEFSPDDLAMRATGFSVLGTELTGYTDWLKTKDGVHCAARVKESSNIGVIDIAKELQGKKALVALNPVGAANVTSSYDSIMRDLWLTMNHERIHVLQANCKSINQQSHLLWKVLSKEERAKMIETHGNYDWTKSEVAARENLAYKFEDKSDDLLELAKDCK